MQDIYIVIAFSMANVENDLSRLVPLYDDSTEKYVTNIDEANKYRAYLESKGKQVFVSSIVLYDTIDVEALKREEALSKLSQEEKELLNLQN